MSIAALALNCRRPFREPYLGAGDSIIGIQIDLGLGGAIIFCTDTFETAEQPYRRRHDRDIILDLIVARGVSGLALAEDQLAHRPDDVTAGPFNVDVFGETVSTANRLWYSQVIVMAATRAPHCERAGADRFVDALFRLKFGEPLVALLAMADIRVDYDDCTTAADAVIGTGPDPAGDRFGIGGLGL